METWFYHLEYRGVDDVLPALLSKALARNWRAIVRTSDGAKLDHFDRHLWTYDDASFLPHGRADAPNASRQPVLVTRDAENLNGAELVILLDGADPVEDPKVQRTIILFANDDAHALENARARWKSLRASGSAVSYWREGKSGSWEKQS